MSAVGTSVGSSAKRASGLLCGVLALVMGVACSSPELKQQPLPYASQRAIEAPDFLLFEGSTKSDPLTGGTWELDAVLVQASYVPIPQHYSSQGTAYVLRLKETPSEGSKGRLLLLALIIPRSYLPNLREGTSLKVQYVHTPQPAPGLPHIGVRILAQTGETLFLADSGGMYDAGVWPTGITVQSGKETAYVTTFLTPSGCRIRKQHFYTSITGKSESRDVAPGEQRIVEGSDGNYQLTVVENYSVHSGLSCLEQPDQGFTYLLERLSP